MITIEVEYMVEANMETIFTDAAEEDVVDWLLTGFASTVDDFRVFSFRFIVNNLCEIDHWAASVALFDQILNQKSKAFVFVEDLTIEFINSRLFIKPIVLWTKKRMDQTIHD